MAYVEHVDSDVGRSNSGAWVILGVVLVLLFLMLMLAWSGVFGTQVQQVIPFYSVQTTPQVAPAPGAPGAPGAGGSGGAAGAPGAPGAAGAPAAPAQTTSPTTP